MEAAIDIAKALMRLSELTIFELRGEWRRLRLSVLEIRQREADKIQREGIDTLTGGPQKLDC
jgi:hypothetical protein